MINSHSAPALTLYYRDGCHLCEDMQEQLATLLPAGSHRLTRIDIDEDPELSIRLNASVPLLMLGERVLSEHFLDLQAVKTALAGYNSEF